MAAASDPYLTALALALVDNSEQVAQLDWKAADDLRVSASISGYMLTIEQVSHGRTVDYVLALRSENGELIASVSDASLFSFRRERAFAELQRLFLSARAKARGTDVAVEKIFASLRLKADEFIKEATSAAQLDELSEEIPF